MRAPRFRIAWVMVAVAIAALNSAAIRAMLGSRAGDFLALGALPMASVLAVGLLIGHRRPEARPYLLGFEAFGATALAIYVAAARCYREEVLIPYLTPILEPIRDTIGQNQPYVLFPAMISIAMIMLGLPQLAFALIGGFLSRRFKVTITHR